MSLRGRITRLRRGLDRLSCPSPLRIDPAKVIAAGRFLENVLRRVRQGQTVEQAVAACDPPSGYSVAWLAGVAEQMVAWHQGQRGGQ
jgi:hypothetical protein